MSPYTPSADLSLLGSGDLATVSDLVARRRATTTVAQAEALAATVVDTDRLADALFREARAAWSKGDHDQMTNVILAAIELDSATPGAPRLIDEIRGIQLPAAA